MRSLHQVESIIKMQILIKVEVRVCWGGSVMQRDCFNLDYDLLGLQELTDASTSSELQREGSTLVQT